MCLAVSTRTDLQPQCSPAMGAQARPAGGKAGLMRCLSARAATPIGPTPDNRIKPDIVAPGSVVSAAAGVMAERGAGPDQCKTVADQVRGGCGRVCP